MAITLKRQLSDDEKDRILEIHGRKCWSTGHGIPEGESVQFDHIRAFSDGGASELDNIAPMCGDCNRRKGRLPLEDFRVKLRLEKFFEAGDRLTLGDLLRHLQAEGELDEFGRNVSVEVHGDSINVGIPGKTVEYKLYECATTNWKYFYATLPVELIDSDDDRDHEIGLQPRYLIFGKVFDLYRHFQRHPVLQPSIGRAVDGRIRVFDGQHKIAGLLYTGRREFECKIYLDPDMRLLNQTNISAHDKFAQTRFFSSIMVMKLGSQFGADFEEYKNQDNGENKSEEGFVHWLRRREEGTATKGDLNTRFRSFLYNSVIEHDDCRLNKFISASNRSSDEKPLTIDQLSKSLLTCFMYRHPVSENMATDDYKRHQEIENVVFLMNALHDQSLHAWNPKAGENDETQRKLIRMYRSKSTMAWSEILRDSVCAAIGLLDSDERERPFYRELSDKEREKLSQVVERLVAWKFWTAPKDDEIDRKLADNKSEVKRWFKEKGLTTGYLLGAPE